MNNRQIQLLASYNAWMNDKLYAAAANLTPVEVARDRGAFFRSILGTLNHIAVADTIWLKRFAFLPGQPALNGVADLPTPAALDTPLFGELQPLHAYRNKLDGIIAAWTADLQEEVLDVTLHYTSMKGIAASKRLGDVILHFFNHQTHHRGQVTTLLTQAGVDVGVTDLIAIVADVA